jgi:hypothetical protein
MKVEVMVSKMVSNLVLTMGEVTVSKMGTSLAVTMVSRTAE